MLHLIHCLNQFSCISSGGGVVERKFNADEVSVRPITAAKENRRWKVVSLNNYFQLLSTRVANLLFWID